MLVTCYEYEGKKYVANQHGDFDIYEGEYINENRVGTIKAESAEMKTILQKAKAHGR
jgi:hypothetical protein